MVNSITARIPYVNLSNLCSNSPIKLGSAQIAAPYFAAQEHTIFVSPRFFTNSTA